MPGFKNSISKIKQENYYANGIVNEQGLLMNTVTLKDWKKKREDKKMELFWNNIADRRKLSAYEEYQRRWNFKETDYNFEPSNNGLDIANPGFAYDKKLVKHIEIK